MAKDFRSARFWARELIEEAMAEGGCAIDATMGNGHDTQWLCELAGADGGANRQILRSSGGAVQLDGLSSISTASVGHDVAGGSALSGSGGV